MLTHMQGTGRLDVGQEFFEAPRYSRAVVSAHWAAFLFVVAAVLSGWIAVHFFTFSDGRIPALVVHASFGALVLALMLGRFWWRLKRGTLRLPEDAPHWQEAASVAMHYALYAILLIMPFTGWAWLSALGIHISLFGVIPIPALVAKGRATALFFGDLHKFLVVVIVGLVGLHTLAAVYHWAVKNDGVMERMVPEHLLQWAPLRWAKAVLRRAAGRSRVIK